MLKFPSLVNILVFWSKFIKILVFQDQIMSKFRVLVRILVYKVKILFFFKSIHWLGTHTSTHQSLPIGILKRDKPAGPRPARLTPHAYGPRVGPWAALCQPPAINYTHNDLVTGPDKTQTSADKSRHSFLVYCTITCNYIRKYAQHFFRAISEQFQSSFRAVLEQFQSSYRAISEQF